jgi:general secretion pathway protein G
VESKGISRTGRKAFTLVELLIVIIIIGILAGAMMMLLGSSSDRAEATKIISNLRSMKSATLQFRADHPNDTELTTLKLSRIWTPSLDLAITLTALWFRTKFDGGGAHTKDRL